MTGKLMGLLALIAQLGVAHAGLVLIPGGANDTNFKAKGAKPAPVRFVVVRAEVGGDRVQSKLEAEVGQVEPGKFAFVMPLAKGVSGRDVSVVVDGVAVDYEVVDGEKSLGLYSKAGEAIGSGALLTAAGRPALFVKSAALKPSSTITIEVLQRVAHANDMSRVDLLMPGAPGLAADRLAVDVIVRDPKPIRGLISPTHPVDVSRPSPQVAEVRFRAEKMLADTPLTLFFTADEDPLGLRVLTHRAEGDSRGYFMVLGNPTGGGDETALPKDVVVVMDTSGSMRGEKMEQARSSLEYVLDHLNAEDRFNVITFGTEVVPLSEGLIDRTPDNVEKARAFIDDAVALGRTNISGALSAALAGEKSAKRPRIVIFMTDGSPTAGVTDPDAILAAVDQGNKSGSKVFVLGLGADVDTHLLDQIAGLTGGDSEYLDGEEEIDVKVASLYDSLSYPVLNGVELTFGDLKVEHVYPARVPALFRGREVLILGAYSGGGTHELALEGNLDGQNQRYSVNGVFPETADPGHDFVANLWAARRIGELLKKIRLDGRKRELIEEVVALSLQFGILTEYTEFLSTEDKVYSREEASEKAVELFDRANAHTSGNWAVNQADNERSLRQQKVSTANMNSYRDRQGRRKKATKVKSVGRSAYYKREGKWVQASPKPAPTKKKRVKRFSEEHLDLVKKNKDFAAAQSLDGDVIYNFDDVQVEVY